MSVFVVENPQCEHRVGSAGPYKALVEYPKIVRHDSKLDFTFSRQTVVMFPSDCLLARATDLCDTTDQKYGQYGLDLPTHKLY